MPLLDHRGRPFPQPTNKKEAPPKLGEAFGNWAGRTDSELLKLPGGGLLQFNLDNLELSDYRQMKDHYQINLSLSVLTFMMHQLDFKIECEDKRIKEHVAENMDRIWGRLVRAKAQAFWAGYSPNVLQWENDLNGNTVQLEKIKDLLPEECDVNWKLVDAWAPPGQTPPKVRVFDGIRQFGYPYTIPTLNSYWYPLLMQNGDYYGKKLLRPAFQSWFFSLLMHLFANRYYERFGEPLPVGRAPYDETVDVMQTDGTTKPIPGNQVMEMLISQIRNRSVVVLPNDKNIGSDTQPDFDYQLEYLESQMRGADFERYMTRLDEEMSLAMFTPLLLMRTGDVGSYSLGETHMKMWLWMLNALADDWSDYMNRYIIAPMVGYNFSAKAPRCRIVFRKMGQTDAETVRAIVTALIQKDKVKPDIQELGQIAGMTLDEIAVVTAPPEPDPAPDPAADPATGQTARERELITAGGLHTRTSATLGAIFDRMVPQVKRAYREGTLENFSPSLGFKRQFEEALKSDGYKDAGNLSDVFYAKMERWVKEVSQLGTEGFDNANDFLEFFHAMLNAEIKAL